jgi:hypothetical protein
LVFGKVKGRYLGALGEVSDTLLQIDSGRMSVERM